MDAFSVCVSYGCCHKDAKITSALRLSFFTGLFQFGMFLTGLFGGNYLGGFFKNNGSIITSWIAFILLLFLGGKMIIDAVFKKEECNPVDISRGKALLVACFATSIDALIAGISLGIMNVPFWISASMIGIITFILSLAGVYIGKFVSCVLGKWAEIVGGVILIAIGVKSLIESYL
jgi:putative Mn2+ efflux pump MntP